MYGYYEFQVYHLVDKSASLQSSDLTPANIGHLEISVEQQIEREGDVLSDIVNADVKVQFFFTQNEPIGETEGKVPHGARHLVVHNAEHGLDIARW